MNFNEIFIDCEIEIKEKIEYIFKSFQKFFPNIRYFDYHSIVGIGEPDDYFLCYFKKRSKAFSVKFKSNSFAVPITIDSSELDTYIQNTIQVFQTNDFLRSERILIEKITELLKNIIPKYGEVLIESLASNTLTERLKKIGINKISDFNDFDFLNVFKENKKMAKRIFNKALFDILTALKTDSIPQEDIKNGVGFLCLKASKKYIKKYSLNTKVISFLESINFAENHFNKGSSGWILCMRKKVQATPTLLFSENISELTSAYLSNIQVFEKIFENTQILLTNLISESVHYVRNREIILRLLAFGKETPTLESIGSIYNLKRESIRQIFIRELKKIPFVFNLYSEEGILNYICRNNYFLNFSNIPIDAFMVYLKITTNRYVYSAFNAILLYDLVITDDLKKRIDETANFFNSTKTQKLKKSIDKILKDDGQNITDLELLIKLKETRARIARQWNLPDLAVYSNKQLVCLATYKPLNKNSLALIPEFSEKLCDKFDNVILQTIIEHVENTEKKPKELYESTQEIKEKETFINSIQNVGGDLNCCDEEFVYEIKKEDTTVKYEALEITTKEILETIVNACTEISKIRCFGETMIVNVLHGSKNQRIFTYKLYELDCYGLLKSIKTRYIFNMIEFLIEKNIFFKTQGFYPMIKVNLHKSIEDITDFELSMVEKMLKRN